MFGFRTAGSFHLPWGLPRMNPFRRNATPPVQKAQVAFSDKRHAHTFKMRKASARQLAPNSDKTEPCSAKPNSMSYGLSTADMKRIHRECESEAVGRNAPRTVQHQTQALREMLARMEAAEKAKAVAKASEADDKEAMRVKAETSAKPEICSECKKLIPAGLTFARYTTHASNCGKRVEVWKLLKEHAPHTLMAVSPEWRAAHGKPLKIHNGDISSHKAKADAKPDEFNASDMAIIESKASRTQYRKAAEYSDDHE